MTPRLPALPLCLLLIAAAPADPGPRFGLSCHGTEVRQEGAGKAETHDYAAQISLDLAARRFCTGDCTRAQSFPIVDPAARPIRLIDSGIPTQQRLMLFDPATMTLTDAQRLRVASLPPLDRTIRATCTFMPFRSPAEPGD